MKAIEAIINEIKGSEELQKKLVEAAKNNTVAEFLKELGCEATVEEFINALKPREGELGDDELGAVSGGANITEAILSISTVGLGCAINAIYSAVVDDGIKKQEGRILCEKAVSMDYGY